MPKGMLLTLALLCSGAGIAWLALAMETHWQQVRGTAAQPGRATRVGLRVLGAAALFGSLLACLHADHASIAVLVWLMSLAAASWVVALTLAWRPRWLAWLARWPGRA